MIVDTRDGRIVEAAEMIAANPLTRPTVPLQLYDGYAWLEDVPAPTYDPATQRVERLPVAVKSAKKWVPQYDVIALTQAEIAQRDAEQAAAEQAARDALSKGGLHGGAGFYTLKLAAPPGSSCVIDILALDAFAAGGRSMDVLIDGTLVKDNWYVPVGSLYNRVLRLRTIADADGIDLRLDRGGIAGTDQNPAISAVALTQEMASPASIGTPPCSQTQPLGGTAVFTVIAGGNPAPTLQWRKNEIPSTGKPAAA